MLKQECVRAHLSQTAVGTESVSETSRPSDPRAAHNISLRRSPLGKVVSCTEQGRS
jgi:hypothetical protein